MSDEKELVFIHESTGFPEVASAILLRTSICTVLVVIVNGYEMKPIAPR